VSHVFEYALLRAVPRQERGESMNVGVIVYCASLNYLCAKTHVDSDRLRALDPDLDLELLEHSLEQLTNTCDGSSLAGPVSQTSPGQRFRWLTAPRSTIIQTSAAHTGFTDDPERDLNRLHRTLVLLDR
jgi:hypothetical protein